MDTKGKGKRSQEAVQEAKRLCRFYDLIMRYDAMLGQETYVPKEDWLPMSDAEKREMVEIYRELPATSIEQIRKEDWFGNGSTESFGMVHDYVLQAENYLRNIGKAVPCLHDCSRCGGTFDCEKNEIFPNSGGDGNAYCKACGAIVLRETMGMVAKRLDNFLLELKPLNADYHAHQDDADWSNGWENLLGRAQQFYSSLDEWDVPPYVDEFGRDSSYPHP